MNPPGEDLYIFLHIPYTAGTTFRNAILNSFNPGATLTLYGKEKSSGIVKRDISDLATEERNSIRFILGHQVWYGIHELFERSPKYITFLRDPVARVFADYYKILRDPKHSLHEKIASRGIP